MSLAQVLSPPPTPNGFEEWTFSHFQHHQAIIRGLMEVKNLRATLYMIYPFNPKDSQTWLELHQQLHNDYESALGISSNDLSSLDFSNQKQVDTWYYLNYSSHRDAAQILGQDYL